MTGKNREKAKFPSGKKFWCDCDLSKVSDGSKCKNCRRRRGKQQKFKAGHAPNPSDYDEI